MVLHPNRRHDFRTPTGEIIDDNQEVTKKNSGEGYVTGVELGGQLNITEQLNLRGAVTWMDGEVDTFPTSDPTLVREPIDRLMPVTAHLATRYDISDQIGSKQISVFRTMQTPYLPAIRVIPNGSHPVAPRDTRCLASVEGMRSAST